MPGDQRAIRPPIGHARGPRQERGHHRDRRPSKPGAPYSMSPIRAPISGTVVSLPQKIGVHRDDGNGPSRKIGDIDHLQVRLQIPEREIGTSAGDYPPSFRSRPIRKSPSPHPSTACPRSSSPSPTRRTRISRSIAKTGAINAGMFARVKLYTRQYRGCVIVPDDAIQSSGGHDDSLRDRRRRHDAGTARGKGNIDRRVRPLAKGRRGWRESRRRWGEVSSPTGLRSGT